jgi:hypothetical protein
MAGEWLIPMDSEQVVVRMDTMHAEKLNEPQLPPARSGLSMESTRWWDQDAIDAAKGLVHVSTKYETLLSSPSRRVLKQAEVVANQSLLISHELDKHEAGKLKALRERKKSRRQAATKGGMIDIKELRREEAKRNAQDEAEMLKRQMAIVEKQAKAEQRERRKAFMKEIAAYKKEKGRRNFKWVVLKGLDPSKLQSILNGEIFKREGLLKIRLILFLSIATIPLRFLKMISRSLWIITPTLPIHKILLAFIMPTTNHLSLPLEAIPVTVTSVSCLSSLLASGCLIAHAARLVCTYHKKYVVYNTHYGVIYKDIETIHG